jgi:hypothetical protein
VSTVKTASTKTPTRHAPKVIRFGCHDTRRNLPAVSSRKRGEANFLGKFERAYLAEVLNEGALFARGREFSLTGYGRADLVWLAWRGQGSEDFSAMAVQRRVRVTAIEAKLKDWRKGLTQAVRYRYFANRAILVLTTSAASTALPHLATFKKLRVGLWEFDPVSERITKHTTPRETEPLNTKAHARALDLIAHGLKLGKFGELLQLRTNRRDVIGI